jgi:predicted nuclease of predicted toxin-antitoxin system
LRGAADKVVAITAIENDAVLIAQDKDSKQLAKTAASKGTKLEKLSLIKLKCEEPMASKRVAHLMDLIEHEWEFVTAKPSRRLWIEIGKQWVKLYR